jgi:hypothetical protein
MKKWIRMVAACAVVLLMGIGTSYAGKGPGTGPITLDSNIIDGLKQMRAEEKLARDVYLAMHEKYKEYNAQIFANIAVSEQRHMDAVLDLLNKYKIDDPVAGMAAGKFGDLTIGEDTLFQDLYDGLIADGEDFIGALEAGVEIENLDIEDLIALLEDVQNIPDIKNVYENLLDGSHNHLDAFNSQLP